VRKRWGAYGPLVTDESGTPVSRRYYWDLYRDVADAAGVPRAVWNMHARHGGATEAQEAGVALQDIAAHAQHADINTTRKHYIVPSVETLRRVARQRLAHRQGKGDKR
jgi:site-specific recombinase XerD